MRRGLRSAAHERTNRQSRDGPTLSRHAPARSAHSSLIGQKLFAS
jgi:hypothetical protein